MAKALVVAHLGRHFRIFGHYDYKVLLDMGFEVHIAANFNDEIDKFDEPKVIKHQIDFVRNPFSKGNGKALKQLKNLFEDVSFNIIHCQSPSGGAVTRYAARKTRKKGTKVLYTAHGLHFYSGAPLINWLLYYHIEKWLGRYTDCIITINEEDYQTSRKKLGIKDVRYIHGVGVDLNKFVPQNIDKKLELRRQYRFSEDDFILVYAGELSYRKHQDLLIHALAEIKEKVPRIKLLLAGAGKLTEHYKKMANQLGVDESIHFLGYRKDVGNLMMMADVAVSSSRQEGLPVNVMEAMATGLPLVVTDCRGNRDLVRNGENGYVVGIEDIEGFANRLLDLYKSTDLRQRYGSKSLDIIKIFSLDRVVAEMKDIYRSNRDENRNDAFQSCYAGPSC